jgi:crotonobetainyl-CoA:carnitine CoA-transferase CaiB-like acyl-CoA transferase
VPEALNLEQVRHRNFIHRFEGDPGGIGKDLQVCLGGYQINGRSCTPTSPPPELGADTDAVLAEIREKRGRA